MWATGAGTKPTRGLGHCSLLMFLPPHPLRLESSREDDHLRCAELEREVTELQQRNQALTSLAQEAQALKDEMDELR